MGKISTDRILLITAATLFGLSLVFRPTASKPVDFASFNDGSLICSNIFIQPNTSREVLASYLNQGAALVEESGCVNYTFVSQ